MIRYAALALALSAPACAAEPSREEKPYGKDWSMIYDMRIDDGKEGTEPATLPVAYFTGNTTPGRNALPTFVV